MALFAFLACLVSGFSSLVFQSLWLRGFGLAYGSSSESTALVLAVFMAGLALGSAWARRLKALASLRSYALAEAALGLSGLLAQALLPRLPPLDSLGLKALVACALVLPCALAAGLTLPLLLETLERRGDLARRAFSRLYAANALGAALGALAAAYLLVPALGVLGSAALAAGLNLGLAALALALRFAPPSAPPAGDPAPTAGHSAAVPRGRRYALAAALSGFAALSLEILWTRSLALAMGSSVYAFALMLAALLLGLGLGALALARRQAPPGPGTLAGAYALAAALALLSSGVLGQLPAASLELLRRVPASFGSYQFFGLLLDLAALLPTCFLLGWLLPALLGGFSGNARAASGALYAANSLGALAGALATAFLLVPALGLQASFPWAAAALAAAGLALAPWPRSARALAGLLLAGLAWLGSQAWRPWDLLSLNAGMAQYGPGLARQIPPGQGLGEAMRSLYRLEHWSEGRQACVAVRADPSGEKSLVIDGKVDASLGTDALTQDLLAHLPLALAPARRALVIGWGSGGTAAAALLHPLERLDAVELEPEVLKAGERFRRVVDERLHAQVADARQLLRGAGPRWDLLISEPSNPWVGAAANLFTAEFYAQARARLAPGGLFCQWFHYYGLEEEDLRLQLRTFAAAFPRVSLWLPPLPRGGLGPSGDIILLGSEAEPDLDPQRLGARLKAGGADLALALAEQTGPAPAPRDAWWLLSLRLLGDAELRAWAGQGPLNTDGRPRLEFDAPRAMFRSPREEMQATVAIFRGLEAAAQALPAPASGPARGPALERLGIHYSRRSLHRLAVATLEEARRLGRRGSGLDEALGLAYFHSGMPDQARQPLGRALRADAGARARLDELQRTFARLGRQDLAQALEQLKPPPGPP